ncbi:MAG TPA: hypothetical protein PK252_13940 [Bacteroidales bacterium]|nr:hypothetical protein [Bacteroidales bacterium]
MKHIFLAILFYFSLYEDLTCQELMRNGSFEIVDESPNAYRFLAKNWYIQNGTSVDYFSKRISSQSKIYGVPMNFLGYHPSIDGDAYCGLVLFSWNCCDYELLTGSLMKSLQKDSIYFISFMLKYAGDSIILNSKEIYIYFSNDSSNLVMSNCYSGNYCDLIDNIGIAINIDSVNRSNDWVNCSILYKAKGFERFVTIGLITKNNETLKKKNKEFRKLIESKASLEKIKKFVESNTLYPIGLNEKCIINDRKKYLYRTYSYYFLDKFSIMPYIESNYTIEK